jgi:hypothetical protein
MSFLRHSSFFLPVVFVVVSGCTKTKLGTYILTMKGSIYTVERKAYCCDTTGTYTLEYFTDEREVKITRVGNSTIEIDGNIWQKDGKSVSFTSSYDSNSQPGHALGGSYNFSQNYSGRMVTNKVIEGTFNGEQFSVTVNSTASRTWTNATFTIIKK